MNHQKRREKEKVRMYLDYEDIHNRTKETGIYLMNHQKRREKEKVIHTLKGGDMSV